MLKTWALPIWPTFLSIFIAVPALTALAAQEPGLCFDLSKPVRSPLRDPIPYVQSEQDHVVSGLLPQGGGWASARGRLAIPISEVLNLLQDPATLKDPKDCDMSFKRQARPGYLDFEDVDITIHPFPLISIRWQEQWGFVNLEGQPDKPSKVLVSYQKVSGTEHIRRYCGNILITALDPTHTDIALYEEGDATRRTPEGIARGHEGTLRTLREHGASAKPAHK